MTDESLCDFLKLLEEEGEIIHVKKEVDPRFELAAVLQRIQDTVNKAVVFDKVKNHEMPVVSNLLGSHRRVALSVDSTPERVLEDWTMKESKPRRAQVIESGPCKEVVLNDEKADLTRLPIVTHHEEDGGPYITAGVVFSEDSEWGTNASFHRMQFVDRNTLKIRMVPGFHLRRFYEKAEEEGRDLDVAVCVGNHPHIMWAGVGKLPLGSNHLDFAGALRGTSIKVVKCETVDVEVPAETEIVIEGRILAETRVPEGPFGDYQGYYIPVSENHLLRVTTITHRENPIYQTILAGSVEDRFLVPGFPVSLEIYKAVKKVVPSVVDVTCWPYVFTAVVKIKKEWEGQPRQALLAGLGSSLRYIKFLIVVDDDIDIYDTREVMWAISTRCKPDKIIILPDVPTHPRDPFHLHRGKVGIDATFPLEARSHFVRAKVVDKEKINLDHYLHDV